MQWAFNSLLTPRLRLRRFAAGDEGVFERYRQQPEVFRFQGWTRPFTAELAQQFVSEMAVAHPLGPGEWFQIAVADREDDQLIGDIGLCSMQDTPEFVELGFTLRPEFQHQGLMSEALKSLLPSLRELGVTRILSNSDTRNLPSLKLLSRLGFQATKEETGEYHGETCVDRYFQLDLIAAHSGHSRPGA